MFYKRYQVNISTVFTPCLPALLPVVMAADGVISRSCLDGSQAETKRKNAFKKSQKVSTFSRSVPKALKTYFYLDVDNNTLATSSCKFSLYYQVVYWPKRTISPHPSYICNKLYWPQNSCDLKILFCFILSQILHFGE